MRLKLTQSEFADKAMIHRNYVCKIENGQVNPSLHFAFVKNCRSIGNWNEWSLNIDFNEFIFCVIKGDTLFYNEISFINI